LTFSPEAIRAISKQAMEKKTGARGLRAIMVLNNIYTFYKENLNSYIPPF